MAAKLSLIICTVGGIGFFPLAPGTAGSMVAVLFLYFIPLPTPIMLSLILFLFLLGLVTIPSVEKRFGSDPGIIVLDEVIGQWLTLLLLPHSLLMLLAGFILFRLFDIFKPLGINALQKLPGAYGVILDDMLAGVYAFVILWFGLWII